VYETEDELSALQELIDRSHEQAGSYAKAILTPDRRLSARQVVRLMGDRQQHLALATVTSTGEPRVSPIDGFLLHGVFYGGTGGESLRARHLRVRPAVSVSCFRDDDFAVTVHGRAELIDEGHSDFEIVDREIQRIYGASLADWGEGNLLIRIHAERMLTFAAKPEDFPE
jgi:Pyridoxamine 5'-phosphate oxidase